MTKIALVFDDGYAKSCHAVADLFERYNLSAVFAVLSEPGDIFPGLGDWPLWNEFAQRGHIVHPHGYDHTALPKVAFDDAVESLERCFDMFAERLPNFALNEVLFHYPYNSGTSELNAWLLKRVAGVRVGGTGFNTQKDMAARIYNCAAYGPDFCDRHLKEQIDRCVADKPAAFVYNLHGVDGEGWGPIHLEALEQVLVMIQQHPELSYWDFRG